MTVVRKGCKLRRNPMIGFRKGITSGSKSPKRIVIARGKRGLPFLFRNTNFNNFVIELVLF